MKRIFLSSTVVLLFLLSRATADAANYKLSRQTSTKTSSVVFRLDVSGTDSSMTYWVAYGPLNNHFGLVRLHSAEGNKFVATQQLPSQGRTIFAYLAGHGVIHTRFGLAPGNPIMTIKRVGPVSMSHIHMAMVHWTIGHTVG